MNSRIILASGIKLDREYKNVLNYSESDMLALVNSNKVAESNTYNFIRDTGSIQTSFSYSQALSSNYIAFQNTDYSSKWFFAWIDKVIYRGNNNTEIYYTVDAWSTWFSNWTASTCYVVKEHVNSDNVGEHTILEGLETGEYVCNSHVIDDAMDNIMDDLVYVISSSVDLGAFINNPNAYDSNNPIPPSPIRKYNGILSGTSYYPAPNASNVKDFFECLYATGQIDAVNGLFMIPASLVGNLQSDFSIQEGNSPASYNNSISKMTSLNGYTPVNKKLLCYPYNYLVISNNNGMSNILHYEDFSTSTCNFKINMAVTPGCSIRMTPLNYKGVAEYDEESINMGKLPICSYPVDMYTNWLTQNSVNIAGVTMTTDDLNMASAGINGTLGVAGSVMTGNVIGGLSSIANTGVSMAQSMIAKKQHSLIPPQARGNLNAGDVITSSNKNNFHFYKMSIRAEFARILDKYFTRFGYTVNSLKVPNITGRPNWNYVQIASGEKIGYGNVPDYYMNIINTACQNGVTIWHNHSNIGNFNLNNSL